MQEAMRTAKQAGDELGAAQYAMQVMYCMLWVSPQARIRILVG